MARLRELLERHVERGALPGAVALVDRGGRVEAEAVGSLRFADGAHADNAHEISGADGRQGAAPDDGAPMSRDTIFRIASITKPLTAAAVMLLVEEGRIALEDPVARWLPELAEPKVVRTPSGPLDDVVPANRPITVLDLLTFRSGHGFAADFTLPAVQALFQEVQRDGLIPQDYPAPDAWMAALARIPLLHQPGEGWLYNTGSDLQGVLIARASGTPLPQFMAERLFEPLGMTDTGFAVPAAKRDRFPSLCRTDPETGALHLADQPEGRWSQVPEFPSGAGGLTSTADDWLAFGRMLLREGLEAGNGRRILSAESVRLMTTDHLTARQRADSTLFLEGQGWGFGGSVDITAAEPWNVPGRYGWVGGSGTSAHVVPATGSVAILMTQASMTGPIPPEVMREFWRYAAETRL